MHQLSRSMTAPTSPEATQPGSSNSPCSSACALLAASVPFVQFPVVDTFRDEVWITHACLALDPLPQLPCLKVLPWSLLYKQTGRLFDIFE